MAARNPAAVVAQLEEEEGFHPTYHQTRGHTSTSSNSNIASIDCKSWSVRWKRLRVYLLYLLIWINSFQSPPPDPPPLAGNPSQPLDPRSPPPTRASLGSSGDCGPNHNNLDNNCSLSSRSPTTSLSAAPLLNLGAASTAAAAASGNTRGTASSPSTPSLVGGSPLTNNTFVPSPPISNRLETTFYPCTQ